MGQPNTPHMRAAGAGARLVPLLLGLFFLSACGPETRPDADSNADAAARALMQAEDYEGAAQEYLKLAGLYPTQAATHQLGAAEAYVAAGRAQSALDILNRTVPGRRQAHEAMRRQLLLAEVALLQQHPEDALSLSAQVPDTLPAALEVRRHDLRARAHDALGAGAEAVQERAALLEAEPGEDLRERATRQLWSGLAALDGPTLQRLVGSGNPAVASWAELAQLTLALQGRREELEPAIADWVATHPGHPAIPRITEEILAASRLIGGQREHVALLLPLSGQFARAGAAVRDGFLLQMYLSGASHPQITILDTQPGNARERYAEAIGAGAKFIVGPLEKEAVAQIAGQPAEVPTLALNEIPADAAGATPRPHDPLLFTFSLAPEDEAIDAARRARADGHGRALVVAPDNDWGARLATAFAHEWQSLGGTVLEDLRYDPERTDYAALTREIFNLDSSQLRAAMLREALGIYIHSGARKRHDADVIFMPTQPQAARQVMPHFRYFGADRVPVYSTSAIFSGSINPRLDHDIDGVRFPDIPWVATGGTDSTAFQQVLGREYGSSLASLRRLYAFGADAWLLVSRLADIAGRAGARVVGETGEIFLDSNAAFRRHLSWAEFRDGAPVALGVPSGE